MIKSALFVSTWDGGVAIETPCKVDTETKEVFDIEIADISGLENLESEEIYIDGEYSYVYALSDLTEDGQEYWYDT